MMMMMMMMMMIIIIIIIHTVIGTITFLGFQPVDNHR